MYPYFTKKLRHRKFRVSTQQNKVSEMGWGDTCVLNVGTCVLDHIMHVIWNAVCMMQGENGLWSQKNLSYNSELQVLHM